MNEGTGSVRRMPPLAMVYNDWLRRSPCFPKGRIPTNPWSILMVEWYQILMYISSIKFSPANAIIIHLTAFCFVFWGEQAHFDSHQDVGKTQSSKMDAVDTVGGTADGLGQVKHGRCVLLNATDASAPGFRRKYIAACTGLYWCGIRPSSKDGTVRVNSLAPGRF